MATEDLKTEIRKDPLNGKSIIVIPSFEGNLYESQTTTSGREIASSSKDGTIVKAITPEKPLFLLEERPQGTGEGIYDKLNAFGADERFLVEGSVLSGLELLIGAFKERSLKLQTEAANGHSLRQFYAYATYDVRNSSLVGRLLSSKEIAPNILGEIKAAEHYFAGLNKDRCMYCDIMNEERQRVSEDQYRLVIEKGCSIGFVPFVASDQHTIHIIPSHVSRLTELSEKQIEELAYIAYRSLERIKADASKSREIDTINVAFHSAPINYPSNTELEEYYHLHIEISPGKVPVKGAPYEIPSSGWNIVTGRPKDIAEKLRQL